MQSLFIGGQKSYKSSLLVVGVGLLLLLNVHNSLSAKSKVHIVYLGERQHNDVEIITKSHHDMLASVVGSKEAAVDLMVYSYKHGFSGFATELTESQAQKIAELPGVVHIISFIQFHSLATTRGWDYLDLSSYSPTNLLHDTNLGDGIIIGLLDTEVDECNGISVGSFHAVARGIPVVCGAGNDGAAAQTVLNIAPWISTVAAKTIDRSFPTRITLANNMTILLISHAPLFPSRNGWSLHVCCSTGDDETDADETDGVWRRITEHGRRGDPASGEFLSSKRARPATDCEAPRKTMGESFKSKLLSMADPGRWVGFRADKEDFEIEQGDITF
ncbi:hypothetical protein ACOSQ4_016820 [Xanthoceras sorbifolium]